MLPVYAYWKFDDFSWGDTRTIAGGNKSAHEEEEGEFDHSKIRMRTWREFQKEEHSNDDDRGQHSRLNSILNLDLLPESSNFHR